MMKDFIAFLYSAYNIIIIISVKSMRMRQEGHVVRMVEVRNKFNISVEKS
jgi:hypothetical protein